jgi:hypothetical protein
MARTRKRAQRETTEAGGKLVSKVLKDVDVFRTGKGGGGSGGRTGGGSSTSSSAPDRNYTPTYTRDSQGRVTRMTVTLKDGEFTPIPTNTRDMAKWGFNDIPPGKVVGDARNRGHILGAQLGGTNHADLQAADVATLKNGGSLPADRWKDYENFVALERSANAPMMKQIEDEVANGVTNHGREVQYTVDLSYDGDSKVPSTVGINAETIDGDPQVSINESIPNVERPDEAGYTLFDRSSVNWG